MDKKKGKESVFKLANELVDLAIAERLPELATMTAIDVASKVLSLHFHRLGWGGEGVQAKS